MMPNAGVAGIRPEGVGGSHALIFIEPPPDRVRAGDWVVLEDGGDATVGRMIVAPTQIVEHALTETRRSTVRHARAEERPGRRAGAGSALLESLGLPDSAIESANLGGAAPPAER